uniref:Mannose receptor, C type 1b n=1 Tax=Mastacembelus armatus TaxID=205130 RepID=A0A7N9AS74_9TELE
RRLAMRITLTAFSCLSLFSTDIKAALLDFKKLNKPNVYTTSFSTDSPFQLTNKATGFCLVKTNNKCNDIRWTTSDRLLVEERNKCLGTQGKTVGSEINLYDCDENSELQKWECKNETMLALKGQELYIEVTADNTAVLSKTAGPNNHLTISGTSRGACTRTYREVISIGGNGAGKPCMFPFMYRDQWFSQCSTMDTSPEQPWCAIETKYEQNELWGYCPTDCEQHWDLHPTTGAQYQLNTAAALTWSQAEISCKQQGASLLTITDPHEQAYVTGEGATNLWIGLIQDTEHGWKWSNGAPYRYIKWDSGRVFLQFSPLSFYSILTIVTKLYLSLSPTLLFFSKSAVHTSFCSKPWIPYNGHCFYLDRTQKTWSDAQSQCRNQGGDLVSIHNVEEQSFVISQLGYVSNDKLWIGLNDRNTEGLFEWIDHSTVTFTSWKYGNPAVGTDIKDCVMITGENGNWADQACEEKHGYICMKMSASQPTGEEVEQNEGCKTGWRRHGSYCYFISTRTKTFDEAKDDCKSSDSYLADVSSGLDNAFLVSLVGMRPEKYFWLGLSNQKTTDEFVWTNTDLVRFTHWNSQMPGHRRGCVAMNTGIFAGLWDVLPCTNKIKYICKHMAEGAILTHAPPTLIPPKCADGWTKLGSRNYCFKWFSQTQRTWYEARDYCMAIGGELLSIHSAAEQHLLPDRHDKVWIGLSAPDPAAGYVWSDGSPLHFQHWEDGEPNNKNNVESCAELTLYRRDRSGSWNDVHCETFHGWLCQIHAGKMTDKYAPVFLYYNITTDGWVVWNGDQYYINKMTMAMEEARHFCQKGHGDLVTINNEAESVFLWKQISRTSGNYWIGLNVDLDGTFTWMDGSPVVFQRWDENQPDFKNSDENCAIMTSSMGDECSIYMRLDFKWFWHDYNCGFEHRSICKRSGSPPVNATVAPTVPPKGGCPQNWKKFQSKCYSINNSQKATWEGARAQCRAMGGNLASILSRHEQVFLSNQMAEAPATDLWIGFHNLHGYSFHWTDGRPVRYNNWAFEVSGQWCVLMTTNSKTGTGKWIKKSCNDTNGYVCLRNLDPSLPDSPEPTTSAEYVKKFNDSIKVVTKKMNWDAARKNCEDDGAQLASLRNDWSLIYAELMALNLQSPLWIGLNKKQTNGYFRYVDGWHMTSSNWGTMEPSSDRNCVYVDVDGKWKTADCTQNMTSICMKSTDIAPTEPSEFPGFCPENSESHSYRFNQRSDWIPFKGYCYLILTQRIEWPDASTNCAKHGGSLASIEDPSEQNFILNHLKTLEDSHSSFWIGLYKTHKGYWQWLDKTVMDYTNWDLDQPDRRDYGMIKVSDGKWKTGNKWNDRPYICKTPKGETIILNRTSKEPQTRSHIILAVVLIITAIVTGTVIIFLFKKSGSRLLIPEKLTTFDNPLFFSNERAQTNMVDTAKLVANAEEENPGPTVTV